MTEFTKTIYIRSDNLGIDTTFMLTFNSEEIPGIFENVNPIAWKVTKFEKAGRSILAATFKFSPGVSVDRITGDGIAFPPLAYTPIKLGEQTSLLKKSNLSYFSTPKPCLSGITIKNETTTMKNFGLGIFEHTLSSPPSTLFLYRDVGAGSTLQVGFDRILRGYVTSRFREGDILRGPVKSPVLFMEDITELDDVTYWKITYDSVAYSYRIERDCEEDN